LPGNPLNRLHQSSTPQPDPCPPTRTSRLAHPSTHRLPPLYRLGSHTVSHARQTQTDNSHSWTPPIRRHTSLLVIIPSQRSLSQHRRLLRTGTDEFNPTARWSNSTSLRLLLAEEESYRRLSTS